MGQAANSNRNASLDDKKNRAAGRSSERSEIRKAVEPPPAKGQTGGAFGADGRPNRSPSGLTQGGGGGGGAQSQAKDEVRAEAGRSTRPARKRKA